MKQKPAMKAGSNLARLVLALCACVGFQLSQASAAASTVTTDTTDYPPGATVQISGNGFLAGETVHRPFITFTL